jgi:hypothetical protein
MGRARSRIMRRVCCSGPLGSSPLPQALGGDLIEQPFREWLSRHQTLLTFALYTEMFWVLGLALSNFTGLPIGR